MENRQRQIENNLLFILVLSYARVRTRVRQIHKATRVQVTQWRKVAITIYNLYEVSAPMKEVHFEGARMIFYNTLKRVCSASSSHGEDQP
jgi:hypothetical protein